MTLTYTKPEVREQLSRAATDLATACDCRNEEAIIQACDRVGSLMMSYRMYSDPSPQRANYNGQYQVG